MGFTFFSSHFQRMPCLGPARHLSRLHDRPFGVTIFWAASIARKRQVKLGKLIGGQEETRSSTMGRMSKEGDVVAKGLGSILLLTLPLLLASAGGCEDSGGLAIAAKAGTLGYGGELTTAIQSDLNFRVGINTLDLNFDGDIADIDYDFGLGLRSWSALVDWFVFDGPLRITGGLVSVNHELDLSAGGLSGELEGIGDGTYDWAAVGTLSGSASIDGVAPYVGIGWGNILDKSKRWGFYSDLGIIFTQSPDVRLAATGTPAGLAADLARESKDIEDDLEPFRYYPVLSVGLFIRF